MPKKENSVTFEEGLAALEALVTSLEGEMPLEDAMVAYREGVKLAAALEKQLDASEKQLKTLSGEEAGP